MKKKLTISLLALLGLLLILISFLAKKSEYPKKIQQSTPVQVMDVICKDVPIYIDAFGSFAASQNVDIKSRVSGQIQKIGFKNGSFVEKGQVLFQLDSESYKAKLMNDEASLEKNLANLKLMELTLNRNTKLASSGAISLLNYETMKKEFLSAKAEVKKAEADILLDKINLKYCTIEAPISGMIGINQVDEGNIVNTDTVMVNIKTIDPLYVNFTVSEKDIPRIKKTIESGPLKLIVSVEEKTNSDSIKEIEHEGWLESLNNTANNVSGTISLQAVLPNKKKMLLPGQFGKMKLIVENKKDALLIHQSAVRLGPDGQYVFIVGKDNKAEIVTITVSHEYGNYYVLEKGKLQAGDKLIVSGLLDLSPGDPVTAQNTKVQL